ncbi:outer membrane protein assembly factor BamD [Marinomonas posidonica]|uniref:Outer membrane protein assembly factor BamD n=1 Tax=Marinomonas posidonica (strain CECT 7376 / NCIMB 14433 / IVIA-Po-181) TaxID=491952 RepID=F6D124_MARPP|nr:outer membrane protein assembly factor BamD [Marinomonas posidonica]AEF53747.1 outer membrane assembly lipoprotein YfiO [Marinomonas posidonica IVIA-Po-181]
MGFYHSLLRFTGIVGFSLLTVACSSQKVQEPDLPERVYYDKAQQALSENLPSTAIKHLKDLDSRYPFGKFSTRAELDLIYAQIEAGEFIAAHATAERFIKNHPDNDSIDYAYYMRALATYKGAESLLSRYLGMDPSERDSKELTKAFNELADFSARYPESQYAPDAKARMYFLREMVSRHELQVAHYYMKRKAPISALRRAQEVLQHYPSTNSVEEALAITIQAYQDLSQEKLAKLNLNILKSNFPNSEYLNDQGNFIRFKLPNDADPGFWYWVSFGLID